MKQFALGILTTVLAGIALFLAQNWIEDARADKSIEYSEFAPSFYFDATKASEWNNQLGKIESDLIDNNNRITATAFTIENKGSKPLENQVVVIRDKYYNDISRGILAVQNDVVPGGEGLNTSATIKDGALTIKYNLLDAGEMHRFWIVRDKYSRLEPLIRGNGLKVKGWDAKIYTKTDPSFWSMDLLFFSIVLSLVVFLIAFLILYRDMQKMFEANDQSFEEFIKTAQSKKKERKG